MRRTKVIHVYLIFEKRNYYFSSVTGIFRHLSEDQIGIKQSTLSHNTENTIVTGRAIIRKSELLLTFLPQPVCEDWRANMGQNGHRALRLNERKF